MSEPAVVALLNAEDVAGGGLTRADRVFAAIQDAIVKGELKPGSKMSEADLAARYGVSRGPLREALRRLEGRKLITRIPHVGVRVISLSFTELIEIYQVREELEGMAARLAATHMSPEQVQGLRHLLQLHEQQAELQEGRAYFQNEGDFDFHYRIVQGSGNGVLMQMLCGELYHRVRLYRYQFSVTEGRPHKAFQEHHHIIEAIAAGDGEMAEILMQRHIGAARRNIEEHFSDLT
ncbi:MAG: GntR family transcriptional regulator [Pseudomonadales bacterium]|nr:GntR family transcriptional regulator [Pseudomonadales bacterium]